MSQDHPPRPRLSLSAAVRETGLLLPWVWNGARYAVSAWGAIGVAGALTPPGALDVGLAVLGGIAGVVAVGAVLRVAVAGNLAGAKALGLGPGGLQVGRAELRLFGAGLLCLLFWAIVVAMLGLTVLALFGGAELNVAAIRAREWGAVGPAWRVAIVTVVGIGAVFIPLMLAARLAMAGPATVAQGRMVSLPAMVISRGNVASLLLGLGLFGLPGLIAIGAFAPLGGWIVSVVAPIGVVWVVVPMTLTFLAVVYRRLEGSLAAEVGGEARVWPTEASR